MIDMSNIENKKFSLPQAIYYYVIANECCFLQLKLIDIYYNTYIQCKNDVVVTEYKTTGVKI